MSNEKINKTRSSKYLEKNKVEIAKKENTSKKPKKKEPIIEEPKKEHSKLFKFFIIIVILIILFLIDSFLICPHLYKINEYKISSNIYSESFHGFKIVQIADIHYGTTINQKELNKIINKINNLNPDMVLFTGDLIDKNITPTENIQKEITESLNNLNADYKYSVLGNEDDKEIFNNIMKDSNFIVLNNESTLLYYKDNTPIVIIGFNTLDTNPDYSIINNKINDIDTTNLYKIILFHESNMIDNILEYKPNLVLTSGTLGGKINIIKPLFLDDNSNKYSNSYYNIDNTLIYISNGLGTTDISLRFNNKPSINFFRLFKEENVRVK